MPVTPFHLGAGVLLKAAAPTRVSWVGFALANVVIDVEPALNLVREGDPAHRAMHTLPGATLAAAACVALLRRPGEWALGRWNRWLSPAQARWLGVGATLPRGPFASGALLGAWSHVGLDALMHFDVAPLAPWRPGNPLLDRLDVMHLHALCLAATALGLVGLLLRRAYALRREAMTKAG